MWQHHLIIEGQRKGRKGLIAGIKKDVVLSGKISRDKSPTGWLFMDGTNQVLSPYNHCIPAIFTGGWIIAMESGWFIGKLKWMGGGWIIPKYSRIPGSAACYVMNRTVIFSISPTIIS